jgi:hypothetical protein
VPPFLRSSSFLLLEFKKKNNNKNEIVLAGLNPSGSEPEFLEPLQNLTVTAGREVKLQCVVKHLGSYKVSKYFPALPPSVLLDDEPKIDDSRSFPVCNLLPSICIFKFKPILDFESAAVNFN